MTNQNEPTGVYGWVKYKDKDVRLTQDAYLNGVRNDEHYTAGGIDADGIEYTVRWEITCTDEDETDESNMCEWEDYTIRITGMDDVGVTYKNSEIVE